MHKNSISNKINRLINRAKPGDVLTTQDMLRFGSRGAVDNALSRLVKTGRVVRLAHGMYYLPKVSPRIGPLSPSLDQIASALARQTSSVIQPIGAAAANALGLSSQVPARAIYLTNGTARRRRVGSVTIELKHAGPRTLAGAGTKAGSVVHALRYLGQEGTSPGIIRQLDQQLSDMDRQQIRRLIPQGPGWMRPVLKQLAEPGNLVVEST